MTTCHLRSKSIFAAPKKITVKSWHGGCAPPSCSYEQNSPIHAPKKPVFILLTCSHFPLFINMWIYPTWRHFITVEFINSICQFLLLGSFTSISDWEAFSPAEWVNLPIIKPWFDVWIHSCLRISSHGKGPVKLIKWVKIAHSFLQFVSNQFHVIILSLPM